MKPRLKFNVKSTQKQANINHKPVEIRFTRRTRPKRQDKNVRNSPIPAWLFKDTAFVEGWMAAIRAWGRARPAGFAALGDFVELTRTYAK